MSKLLTPQQAAEQAKCGRTSIMRALSSGELKGKRDNTGRWQIAETALEDWLTMRSSDRQRPASTAVSPPVISVDTTTEVFRAQNEKLQDERDQARLEVASLRSEVTQLHERIADLRADRDRWHVAATTPQPGLLERLRRIFPMKPQIEG